MARQKSIKQMDIKKTLKNHFEKSHLIDRKSFEKKLKEEIKRFEISQKSFCCFLIWSQKCLNGFKFKFDAKTTCKLRN